ncbi:hypothetical protein EC9_49440 [Rosistilla ulvae]|uniref:Uncharacterized protein n=1 Tax=Rosistilla ulvae TaxID=1930277 RepID=A0A517M760_9BACT|nr:hypothetical protein [Rosistilla ulvae]QDS90728.1 hypothetical protein EC9_49440 [Rosistilla ulvae]
MRLTVRTLLAYLDHVLPEEANEALSAKLRDSPYATQLADKIKASIQRTDLGAPAVGAVHPIEDANTIAEYLDSVLPGERIPEVERVLLESDVHMSEAAACHQILTLVLSRPALVPHGLRDRIYQLSQGLAADSEATAISPDGPLLSNPSVASLDLPVAEAATVERGPAQEIDSASTVAVPFRSAAVTQSAANGHAAGLSPRRPDVPEYLRAGRPSRILPWLMTLGLCAVLLFIIAKAFQPVSRLASDTPQEYTAEDPLRIDREDLPAPGFGPVGEQPDTVVVEEASPRSPAAAATGSDLSAVEIPAATAPAAGSDSVAPAADESTMPAASATPAVAVPAVPAPASNAPESNASDPAADPKAVMPTSADPVNANTVPSPQPPAELAPEEPAMPAPPAATEPVSPAASLSPEPAMEPAAAAAPADPPAPVDVAQQVGVLESQGTLLLSRTDAGWERVTKGAAVVSGSSLVNLPTFRSRILLADGVALTSVGEADFSFAAADDSAPTINLAYGRFVLESATPDATVELNLAGQLATLHLPTAESRAAIQVAVFRAPGADPVVAESIQQVVALQVLAGSVGWTVEGGDDVSLAERVRWSRIGTAEATNASADSPAWAEAPEANAVSIDSLSRKGLLELIDETKTIEISLREAVGFRRAEVAALAARSLLALGVSDVYFGTKGIFENDAQKSHWQEHFVAVQSHLDRGGQYATDLRDSIFRMDAARAPGLYRLLWGYSPEQLASGEDFALIEALNDGALATRVLALENLREITGTTLNFRPQETGPRRAAAAKKWDTKLAAKDLVWGQPPTPLSVLER